MVGMSAARAEAAETHVFDPLLSLTGGCTVSKLDPVEDPSCPAETPSGSFSQPVAVTTDDYGNLFIAVKGRSAADGTEGRIDIFNAQGEFVSEMADFPEAPPIALAVDSEDNLYVYEYWLTRTSSPAVARVVRYTPTVKNPAAGELAYEDPPALVAELGAGNDVAGVAVNRENGHLFVHLGHEVAEYGSAAEGNPFLGIFAEGIENFRGTSIAVDAERDRVYVSAKEFCPQGSCGIVEVFDLHGTHALLQTIKASATPSLAGFSSLISIAVDEGTGHVFVYDGEGSNVVYEFTASGQYVSTVEHSNQNVLPEQIAIDNGPQSPNGALNPDGRYLFVPSHPTGVGHVFAFGPQAVECTPVVESVASSGITESEARLHAVVSPCNGPTSYAFQYTTQSEYEAQGFAGVLEAGSGQIASGSTGIEVSASAFGLQPDTAYRFRVVATNATGTGEAEGSFITYPGPTTAACPNDALRIGPSALLPDCRAYELVTPPDTNGRSPQGVGWLGTYFETQQASPAGDKVSFQIEGGTIPGYGGTGAYGGDPYLATRTANGWITSSAGPTGAESPALVPGSTSSDQGYSFWSTGNGEGSASIGGEVTSYVRYPDGHSALVGRGSLNVDPRAIGLLISENGTHIIFRTSSLPAPTAVQLEGNAPPDGTQAIYDRTADEVTHVVSLLPGNVTPGAGEFAYFEGASTDGRDAAFRIGSTLYVRHDDVETVEVGENLTFDGISTGAPRVFYVKGGNLFAYDIGTRTTIPFSSSGNVTVVNVASDGTTAYFVSPSVLTSQKNPNGVKPKAGQENLYLSREGAISFVGTVSARDVEGSTGGNVPVEGLGLWTAGVGSGALAPDPSRTTPDGNVLLFESRAALTAYDSSGRTEVYRYDAAHNELTCLSCNPVGAGALGNASLQSINQRQGQPEPFGPFAVVTNLRPDGKRAFFQSPEALVATDTDGLQDVYEWEAAGVGTCTRPAGCVYLISSGHSERVDHLYAVSDSGDDVFFRTADRLLPSDTGGSPSIYDARVGGGFPEPQEAICQGEGCRPGTSSPPTLPSPSQAALGAHDNVGNCPKGKRRVKRHGKVRCVRMHRKHSKHRRHRSGSGTRGAAK
jgi:hypothetical protein